jgi:hypothetical protein
MTRPDQPGRHRVVACGSHLFALVDGRRVWLTPPPPDQLPDSLLPPDAHTDAHTATHTNARP